MDIDDLMADKPKGMSNSQMQEVISTKEYEDFTLRQGHSLNKLMAVNDRMARLQALKAFEKEAEKDNKNIEVFYRNVLCKHLVIALEDQVEKHRSLSISIISTMVDKCGFHDESEIILTTVCNRMGKHPFPEPSEEVRVELIELLDACLEADSNQFVPSIGKVTSMLGKAATDANPEMKRKIASFCGKLAIKLDKSVGSYFRPVVDSLILNLQHQHSKVRKVTLQGLRDVLSARGAAPFLEGNSMAQLKFSMNDRSQDVRLEFYQVLFHWMEKIEIHYLKMYEAEFVQFLLNGIADDKLDIGPKCITFLEEHGKRMNEALIALGEEEEFSLQDEEPEAATEQPKDDSVVNMKAQNLAAAALKTMEGTQNSNIDMEDID